ncbi:triphosphoribosyl-dephospho-CoA synthase [Halalkalibacter krulwichiae]|uniref:triphosphoribosyl-dephospho-CoA synthase n=1 Tax=Halalkalibacter krulwichiae TaxID=199441 RepID=A0A1X9ME39_9BACI|nr:triphosphoribosyl-dephospho-CoA synthase [Halalkalibacter krulwichiae]ARK29801.1 2-(5''-triphosphoribosyl)-3'-dephosphocoenzyme-A synthase [Halalkalibacter krulwichiae]
MSWQTAMDCSEILAQHAVTALIEEAELTPKPGLVDKQNSGSHSDMSCELMITSAKALEETFAQIALVSYQQKPSQSLREKIAEIGRSGEKAMFRATGGVNTHKGAIWALGLLISSKAMASPDTDSETIAKLAGELARYHDRYVPTQQTNGLRIQKRYGVPGAKGEAEQGFPHLRLIGLPALHKARQKAKSELHARIDTLLALMANLDDTCILHRGGMDTLLVIKEKADRVLVQGGVSTAAGWEALADLDLECERRRVSPGGSADLLAATIFLDAFNTSTKSRCLESSVTN